MQVRGEVGGEGAQRADTDSDPGTLAVLEQLRQFLRLATPEDFAPPPEEDQ